MKKPKSKTTKLLDKAESTLAIVLAPISLAIVLSWNTTPNQALYPLKQALEEFLSLVFS